MRRVSTMTIRHLDDLQFCGGCCHLPAWFPRRAKEKDVALHGQNVLRSGRFCWLAISRLRLVWPLATACSKAVLAGRGRRVDPTSALVLEHFELARADRREVRA